ncbi:MAG: hypothetical protein DHS20C14_05650 [Phycisphaeraceae bacterium]|nr:MAG: hypothetical protein DHS20C14_05650 [Phycisphaeraceae bacterium]
MKTLILTMLASAGTCHAQNLLVNGDLELPLGGDVDDITAWTLTESISGIGGFADSASIAGFANHTPGGERGLWFKSFAGDFAGAGPVDAVLTQSVLGSAGEHYTLSAWFRYEANYSGADAAQPTQTLLGIDFLDAGMGVLGTVEIDVDMFQSADNTWRQYFVDGVAPVDTAFVRARAEMSEGLIAAQNPQSAFVDDFALVPAPGGVLALGLAGLAGVRRSR